MNIYYSLLWCYEFYYYRVSSSSSFVIGLNAYWTALSRYSKHYRTAVHQTDYRVWPQIKRQILSRTPVSYTSACGRGARGLGFCQRAYVPCSAVNDTVFSKTPHHTLFHCPPIRLSSHVCMFASFACPSLDSRRPFRVKQNHKKRHQ